MLEDESFSTKIVIKSFKKNCNLPYIKFFGNVSLLMHWSKVTSHFGFDYKKKVSHGGWTKQIPQITPETFSL